MAIGNVIKKVFGTKHDRNIKKLRPAVARINALEPSYEGASDAELQAMTAHFKEKLDQGASLEDLLPDAFAVVRETGKRVLEMRHFDVQLIGGMILNDGQIAEMKTGEGKTLVATLPAYLNALSGKGVHVITVNDYLASRDAEWMGRIYGFLGMEVGTIVHGLSNADRRASYKADIAYGTNNEFGFDYLRDNMKLSLEHMVQRGHSYAIIDEVDSILIDEARTPLIISGSSDRPVERYYEIDKVIPGLQQEIDFLLDEESRSATLTDEGIDKVEKRLGISNLFLTENIETLHLVNQALRAHTLYKRDRDYVIRDGQVLIVDPFTGRLMPGRRWSDGLHQAVEAKEQIAIEKESETLATITYQKYFLKYDKLSGMTGTADTEEAEFQKIYEVGVTVIPTNQPCVRDDADDVIYKTEPEKFDAVVEEIREQSGLGRPVLVGTASVDKSELLHRLLTASKIPHHVLNAKHHKSEAEIVAQAGRPGSVTISTNMAGRGTDILLGGNPNALAKEAIGLRNPEEEGQDAYDQRLAEETARYVQTCEQDKTRVLELGGLHVVGTERHESRRIDNQLRGRAGRQGDPGSSRFFLSLEDDLLRIFGSDRMKGMMERLGMEDGIPLEHPWLSKAVGNAQGKVEGRNFGIRKNLLEYDEVMSQQRDAVYGLRMQVIEGEDTEEMLSEIVDNLAVDFCRSHLPDKGGPEDLDPGGLNKVLADQFKIEFSYDLDAVLGRHPDEIATEITGELSTWYQDKQELIGDDNLRYRERYFLLNVLDQLWKNHLQAMDHLRGGIGLRGYGQRNPLLEYKREGFDMFQMMLDLREQQVVERLFENLSHERALTEEEKATLLAEQQREEAERAAAAAARANRLGGPKGGPQRVTRPVTVRRVGAKVGRNDPCPCGSGKKYKKCCMNKDAEAAATTNTAEASGGEAKPSNPLA